MLLYTYIYVYIIYISIFIRYKRNKILTFNKTFTFHKSYPIYLNCSFNECKPIPNKTNQTNEAIIKS